VTSAVATGPLNRLFTREESKVKRLRLKVKKSQYGLRGGLGLPMGLLSLMLFLSLASQAWSQDNAESRLAENNGAAHSSADASSVKESSDEASSAVANSAGEGAAGVRSQAIYVPLDPAFVVNYGGPGRLQFLKAELTVRVGSDRDAAAIRHHTQPVDFALQSAGERQLGQPTRKGVTAPSGLRRNSPADAGRSGRAGFDGGVFQSADRTAVKQSTA
jgi:flagellar basal body-associated protein FliL